MPEAGQDLVLTLDLQVQKALEEVMQGVDRGAAVGARSRTAGSSAWSAAGLRPQRVLGRLSSQRWRELSSGGANPLLNRAIPGYAIRPARRFKIVTMISALGPASPGLRRGWLPAAATTRMAVARSAAGSERAGSLDLVEALQHSCDVYFYQLGLKLGLERLARPPWRWGSASEPASTCPRRPGG